MSELYPYGYAGAMLTRSQLEAKSTVAKLNPEFWRRYIALMEDASDRGVSLGVGTGWRVQPSPPPPGFAQPGNSNHEGFPADGTSGGAVAIDTVPSPSWDEMEGMLASYGLRSFRDVNDEPWHIQPIEIPASRSWRKEPWNLEKFILPGEDSGEIIDLVEDDMTWRVAKLEGGAFYLGDGKTSVTCGDSGHDISMDESLIRMAPGAVNTVRVAWNGATDANAGKPMVTSWGGVTHTWNKDSIRRYVGTHSTLA